MLVHLLCVCMRNARYNLHTLFRYFLAFQEYSIIQSLYQQQSFPRFVSFAFDITVLFNSYRIVEKPDLLKSKGSWPSHTKYIFTTGIRKHTRLYSTVHHMIKAVWLFVKFAFAKIHEVCVIHSLEKAQHRVTQHQVYGYFCNLGFTSWISYGRAQYLSFVGMGGWDAKVKIWRTFGGVLGFGVRLYWV